MYSHLKNISFLRKKWGEKAVFANVVNQDNLLAIKHGGSQGVKSKGQNTKSRGQNT